MGFQYAYKEGHSTSTALAQMTDDWLKTMDDRKLVGAVLLDFNAAFDGIDHELLLGKLKCYGFKSAALYWMESDLSSRRQKVCFKCLLFKQYRYPLWCSSRKSPRPTSLSLLMIYLQ